jgi:hypothetical protein
LPHLPLLLYSYYYFFPSLYPGLLQFLSLHVMRTSPFSQHSDYRLPLLLFLPTYIVLVLVCIHVAPGVDRRTWHKLYTYYDSINLPSQPSDQ